MQLGSDSDLCKSCKRFFGNPQTNGMCSSCYKLNLAKMLGPKVPQKEPEPVKKAEEEKKDKPTPEKPKQTDVTKCWKCKIKVGYLGYPCKCGYTFCGKHRYFDAHECTYDYKAADKKKILKANPTIESNKLEQL